LLACKQILKDDVKREQYDYAVAHPDQVRWLLLPFSVPSCWQMIQCSVGVLPLQEIDCVRIGRLCELPQWAIVNHERYEICQELTCIASKGIWVHSLRCKRLFW
jgi:hypothetical protein